MGEIKTKVTNASVQDFINSVDNEVKVADSKTLVKLFEEITGYKAKLWGDSIIGFGSYHYKSKSGQEGDWPLTGFSPRKQNLSIYIMPGFSKYEDLLQKLGKHKKSVSCLYVNKLEDIDINILAKMVKDSVAIMKKEYNVTD